MYSIQPIARYVNDIVRIKREGFSTQQDGLFACAREQGVAVEHHGEPDVALKESRRDVAGYELRLDGEGREGMAAD